MTNGASDTESVFRLMYRSRNLIAPEQRKTELGTLFSAARSKNKKRQITGALLLAGEHFVQTLEGDETSVRELFAHIETDPRHDEVAVVETGDVDQRVFARWAMARLSADGEPDNPLIAHQDGISPAASRGATAEQEALLQTMRDAAGQAG